MHPLVRLAIQAVEYLIATGKSFPYPNPLSDDLKQNAGAFVTIMNQE
jgi:AMMECR1 domain-containing protein